MEIWSELTNHHNTENLSAGVTCLLFAVLREHTTVGHKWPIGPRNKLHYIWTNTKTL